MMKCILPALFFAGVLVACADDSSGPETKPQVAAANPQLRHELLDRMNADQDARKAFVSWCQEHHLNVDLDVDESHLNQQERADSKRLIAVVHKIDGENRQWLNQTIEKQGWPTNSLVGSDGANAAWLLVQHADADLKFQRKCLDLMAALPKNEVSQTDFAYLTDRVLLAEGKKQIYGTQFDWIDGKLQPQPLEDDINVDKRRAEVGMPPLAEYAKEMREMYIGDSKK
jgi:hypothetical protein